MSVDLTVVLYKGKDVQRVVAADFFFPALPCEVESDSISTTCGIDIAFFRCGEDCIVSLLPITVLVV